MQWLASLRRWWNRRHVSSITPENARRRVRRGAAFLDDADPGWYRNVDPSTLELASGTHCVLGQLHGDFRLGLGRSNVINLSSAPRASLSPTAYGFRCVQGVPDAWQDRDYEMLDRAWQEAIRKRQAADPSVDGPSDDGRKAGAPGSTSETGGPAGPDGASGPPGRLKDGAPAGGDSAPTPEPASPEPASREPPSASA
jgi:hypothetical protein